MSQENQPPEIVPEVKPRKGKGSMGPQTVREFVSGKPRMGKSFYMGARVEEIKPDSFIIIDPHREHHGLYKFNARLLIVQKKWLGNINWEEMITRYPKIIIQPNTTNVYPDEFTAEMTDVMRAIFVVAAREKRESLVVIDEAHKWSKTQAIDREFDRLIREGGKYGISIIYGTQRPIWIHSDFVDLADRRTFFQLDGAHDFAAIDKGDYIPNKETLERIKTLKPHQFLMQDSISGKVEIGSVSRRTKHFQPASI